MTLIIQSGARQYLTSPGQHIIVNRLDAEVDTTLALELIHAYGDDAEVKEVGGKIIGHQRGEKVIVAKYKPKSNYRRRYGPRQEETIIEIVVTGGKSAAKPAKEVKEVTDKPVAKKAVASKPKTVKKA
jgi:large subunit ribosomal protein L21